MLLLIYGEIQDTQTTHKKLQSFPKHQSSKHGFLLSTSGKKRSLNDVGWLLSREGPHPKSSESELTGAQPIFFVALQLDL